MMLSEAGIKYITNSDNDTTWIAITRNETHIQYIIFDKNTLKLKSIEHEMDLLR
jgi:hypothetical protein